MLDLHEKIDDLEEGDVPLRSSASSRPVVSPFFFAYLFSQRKRRSRRRRRRADVVVGRSQSMLCLGRKYRAGKDSTERKTAATTTSIGFRVGDAFGERP